MLKTMLFFGTEEFSATILSGLLDNGFAIDAVISKPDTPSGRGQKIVSSAVKVTAEKHGIPVLQPANLLDSIEDITSYSAPAAVLASYGKIVPQAILDLFPSGIINVHPSLLPKYRGSSPIETAILNGDVQSGVSLMQLVAEMDAGPVYTQKEVDLTDQNADQAYSLMAKAGLELLVTYLPAILDGRLKPSPQDGVPTYTQKIKKSDSVIDWNMPSDTIARQIAAYHHWPQSRARIGNLDVIITAAHAVPSDFGQPGELDIVDDEGLLMVQTQSGYLCIDAVKPPGKKEMPIKAFLAGYRPQL
jgi:methionyl-tRNA formyltransferase